ncbi:RxLR effector protein [Phytophthora cinnamomi]|uniref:RxLR effector protein n=1 Tax=Phytophthora cinnamomi TaxID=4785 RepID=UPI0035593C46|nr:RxLR effector protein [Phytophthora cinnamomi]
MWLMSRTHPKDVFSLLRLGEKTMRLDDNPQLLEWFRYGERYKTSTKKPFRYDEAYKLLKETRTQDGDLAQLFESLKRTSDLKQLGTKLQSSHFDDMIAHEVRPDALVSQMGIVDSSSTLPKGNPRRQIDEDYNFAFLKHLHQKQRDQEWDKFFTKHEKATKEV